MCKFIDKTDVKHIMTSLIKTIMSVLKALTDIITNIPACTIGLTEILVIMSVSIFKIGVILYISSTTRQGDNTARSVYKGNSREPENVVFMSSCSLYTG